MFFCQFNQPEKYWPVTDLISPPQLPPISQCFLTVEILLLANHLILGQLTSPASTQAGGFFGELGLTDSLCAIFWRLTPWKTHLFNFRPTRYSSFDSSWWVVRWVETYSSLVHRFSRTDAMATKLLIFRPAQQSSFGPSWRFVWWVDTCWLTICRFLTTSSRGLTSRISFKVSPQLLSLLRQETCLVSKDVIANE